MRRVARSGPSQGPTRMRSLACSDQWYAYMVSARLNTSVNSWRGAQAGLSGSKLGVPAKAARARRASQAAPAGVRHAVGSALLPRTWALPSRGPGKRRPARACPPCHRREGRRSGAQRAAQRRATGVVTGHSCCLSSI